MGIAQHTIRGVARPLVPMVRLVYNVCGIRCVLGALGYPASTVGCREEEDRPGDDQRMLVVVDVVAEELRLS